VADNDAWRAYVELVLGLTETSRKKAMKIVQQVAGKGGATAEQLQELVAQGIANREAMTRMIRVELDRALGKVGLATMDEVEDLTRRIRELEKELQESRGAAGVAVTTAPAAAEAATGTTTTATAAKKTVAKKAAKTTPARTTPAKATTTPAKATGTKAAKSAPAKTAATTAAKTTRKAPAKTAGTRPAKRSATGTGK
jgi:polyhydroxyalkanoate synthesis regulator phasin